MNPRRIPTLILSSILASTLLISRVDAHCPLCTAGIAAAAAGATVLGVKTVTVGLFVGAFAVSTGMWFANSRKIKGVKKLLIAMMAFLVTVVPLKPAIPAAMSEYIFVYVSIAGDYGSPLNRTYLLNPLLTGSLIGAAVVMTVPRLSRKLTELRGKKAPFQGVVLTISLLTVAGAILQVLGG